MFDDGGVVSCRSQNDFVNCAWIKILRQKMLISLIKEVELNEIMKSKDTTFYIWLSHEENSLRKNIREKRLLGNCQTYPAA